MKRILILADLHSGHKYGLAHLDDCCNSIQRNAWQFVEEGLRRFGPFHVIVVNGDAIDGNGNKNGGVELMTTDRLEQVEIAERALRQIARVSKSSAPLYYFTKGTPYHTGKEEDFETVLAQRFQTPKNQFNIKTHYLLDVDGVVFDFKHKIGRSELPHGRATAVLREALMSVVKQRYDQREAANVIVRSHVHYHMYTEDREIVAFTTPVLQVNSAYGQRECSGLTDFGFVVVEVENQQVVRFIRWISNSPLLPDDVIKV